MLEISEQLENKTSPNLSAASTPEREITSVSVQLNLSAMTQTLFTAGYLLDSQID